ncbi:hypothetical protein [Megasphaera massiliensis]|uniref:hypothetical protein n=1 Tax=Megasphaera massiliensis TaxID=1232428 RepID=UPI00259A4F09|nr:hypothetical protein [uncultured Megasphaera sp.]
MAQQVSAHQLRKIQNQIEKRRNDQERFQRQLAESRKAEERLARQQKEMEYQYLAQLIRWTDFPVDMQDCLIGCILECKEFLDATSDVSSDSHCQAWRDRYLAFCRDKQIAPIFSSPVELASE